MSVEVHSDKPNADLSRVLLATHVDYDLFSPSWKMYLETYQGIDILNYLHKHLRESKDSLVERKKRAYYLNYCEPVVDLYSHYIFSKQVSRKFDKDLEEGGIKSALDQTYGSESSSEDVEDPSRGEGTEATGDEEAPENLTPTNASCDGPIIPEGMAEEWEEWLDNVDRRGTSMDRFMAEASRYAFALGHVHILMDMPSTTKPITTEQERKDENIRPYLVMYYPQDMHNFAYDEFGELIWARFEEKPPAEKDPFKLVNKSNEKTSNAQPSRGQSAKANLKERYIVTWTRNEWFKHKVSQQGAIEVGRGKHPLKRVPVVTVYNNRHAKYKNFGKSLIKEIARINIAILNWASLLDEEIYQKCLNILCLSKQAVGGELVIGTNNTLEYDGQPPFFLTPATDPGNFISMMMDKARDSIFTMAKLGGSMGAELNVQKSGLAHAYEFNETNRMLAEKASEFELCENNLHKLWFKYLGFEWKGSVDYPDTFSVETFDQDLQTAMSARDIIQSPTLQIELQKKAAAKILRNADKDVVSKVYEEIVASVQKAEEMKQMQNQQQQDAINNPQPDPNQQGQPQPDGTQPEN